MPFWRVILCYHTSTDFSLYKSLKLLKLAKSLGKDYLPEKGVIVEKTNTQFCVSQSAPLYILWHHVIVVSAMPFLEEAMAQITLFSCTSTRLKV